MNAEAIFVRLPWGYSGPRTRKDTDRPSGQTIDFVGFKMVGTPGFEPGTP